MNLRFLVTKFLGDQALGRISKIILTITGEKISKKRGGGGKP